MSASVGIGRLSEGLGRKISTCQEGLGTPRHELVRAHTTC